MKMYWKNPNIAKEKLRGSHPAFIHAHRVNLKKKKIKTKSFENYVLTRNFLSVHKKAW